MFTITVKAAQIVTVLMLAAKLNTRVDPVAFTVNRTAVVKLSRTKSQDCRSEISNITRSFQFEIQVGARV
jgi:hypothetical protein